MSDVARDLPLEAYLGAMAALDGMGPVTMRRLLALGTPAEVWNRIVAGGLGPAVVASLPPAASAKAHTWAGAAADRGPDDVWQRCRRAGAGATSIGSPGYPARLVDDPEPPIVLFHRGDPGSLAAPSVAIVGTRRATGYGRRVAHELGAGLTRTGVAVVSGLALGIDAAAHRGAVEAFGTAGSARRTAPPVAVVAGGVDAPGPATNAELARSIVDVGVVLSEVPPGVAPQPWRFPSRNRILAALADVVVVVESGPTGGSMITVEEAQRRDRPVLAVPGPIHSAASVGTNQLLRDGASVCTGIDDVLDALGSAAPVVRSAPGDGGVGDGGAEAARVGAASVGRRRPPGGPAGLVLERLEWRPHSIEDLAAGTGLGLAALDRALVELEADGWVQRRGPFVERTATS